MRLAKTAVWIACLVPLAIGVADFFLDRLGANPIAEILNRLGFWTLVILWASLACTPLRLMTGSSLPAQLRRLLGLFAFFYATLHLATYVGLDQFFDLDAIRDDLVKRRFITVGFLAWLTLLPLALTSTKGWMRRLGGARWQRLHRLVYVSATLGLVHFLWRPKVIEARHVIAALLLAAFFVVRVAWAVRRRAATAHADGAR